jgi:urea transport system permease protein
MMVIWVAVGGRGTLVGAVVGALLVNAGQSFFSEQFPNVWQYFLGALFIGVVLLFPQGIVGSLRLGYAKLKSARAKQAYQPVPGKQIQQLID